MRFKIFGGTQRNIKWHRWFAWHPVFIKLEYQYPTNGVEISAGWELAWLTTVSRKWLTLGPRRRWIYSSDLSLSEGTSITAND